MFCVVPGTEIKGGGYREADELSARENFLRLQLFFQN